MTFVATMEFVIPSFMPTNQNKLKHLNLVTGSIFKIFKTIFQFG
jgi:hypothetical protein